MIRSEVIRMQSKGNIVNSIAFLQNVFKGRLDIHKGDNSTLSKL